MSKNNILMLKLSFKEYGINGNYLYLVAHKKEEKTKKIRKKKKEEKKACLCQYIETKDLNSSN